MNGFSLESAAQLYESASFVDEVLQAKHKERLWTALKNAIQQRRPHLDYIIPATIPGVVPHYDMLQMTVFLVQFCRENGFEVEVLNAGQGQIRISGWYEQYQKKLRDTNIIEVFKRDEKPPKGALSKHLQNLELKHSRK